MTKSQDPDPDPDPDPRLPLFEECLVYQLPVSDQLIPQPAQTFPGKNPAWDRENLVVKKAVKSESNSLFQSQQ